MSESNVFSIPVTFDYSSYRQYLPVRVYAKDGVKVPEYKTAGAGCMDVRADACLTIKAKEFQAVPTGLFIEVPDGWCMRVVARSGLSCNCGIVVMNANGAVDSDYRGEFMVILGNLSDTDFVIDKGDRIAQIDFHRVTKIHWEVVPEKSMLTSSERGANGLGHTGLK